MVARVSAAMLGRVHDLVGVLSSDRAGEGHHGGLTVDRSTYGPDALSDCGQGRPASRCSVTVNGLWSARATGTMVPMNSSAEHVLEGGNVAEMVVRVGSTVRKPASDATAAVEALLDPVSYTHLTLPTKRIV